MSHTLIDNVEKASQYKARLYSTDTLLVMLRKLTTQITEKHGAELFPSSRFMRGPVDSFGPEGDIIAEARSRKLEAKYTMEFACNGLPEDQQKMVEEQIFAALVSEIYAEFLAETKKLALDGLEMYPYVLLDATLQVDPDTFQPCIGFVTRYGVGPKA